MSLNVLEEWPRSAWSPEAAAIVTGPAARDPDPRTRELAADILAQG
jgi:hypothetical protein